jgi:hypothetical protein
VKSLESNVQQLGTLTANALQSAVELENLIFKKLAIPDKIEKISRKIDRASHQMKLLHQFNVHIQALNAIYMSTVQNHHDLSEIIQGKLTINFISPNRLREILRFVNHKVQSVSPNLRVDVDVKQYYKAYGLVTCTHDNNHLYLKLRIPISHHSHRFELYEVTAVPVPVDHRNSSDIYTVISGFKPYLAVSTDKRSYIEYTKSINDLGVKDILPTSVNRSTCTSSLVFGNASQIIEKCTKVILLDSSSFPDMVQRQTNGSVLMFTPQTTWSVICNNTLIRKI